MDRLSGIDHSEGWSGRDATYAGIDNPVSICADERRMHVRAYNFWVSLLDARAYPSIEDLNPDELTDFGPNSVLLDFTEGIDNPAIAYIGSALREECGLEDKIGNVADVPPRSLLSRLTDHYLQIIANRAPIGFEAEFTSARDTTMLYRGILMPFSSDDDVIDFIYGVVNWKEVAEKEEELQREVAQALSGVFEPALPPVEAWADGPSGNFEPLASGISAEKLTKKAATSKQTETLVENEFSASAADNEFIMAEDDNDGSDAGLADLLAIARETAELAQGEDVRSRLALYNAIGRAYDFALAAEMEPEGYHAILSEAGITQQDRAPMTPVAKLVFGPSYDKTRLAEVSAALSFARTEGVAKGAFADYIEKFPGGLKGLVGAHRAAKRGQVAPGDQARESVRKMEARVIIEFQDTRDEFVVFVARRLNDGHVGIVAAIEDDAGLIDRAVRRAARSKT